MYSLVEISKFDPLCRIHSDHKAKALVGSSSKVYFLTNVTDGLFGRQVPSNINTNSLLVASKRHLFGMGQKITKIKELDSRSNIKK